MSALDYDLLRRCVSDRPEVAEAAAVRVTSEYEPSTGRGTPIAPPIYSGDENDGSPRLLLRPTTAGDHEDVIIDSVPASANRLEDALLAHHRRGDEPTLPVLRLDADPHGQPQPITSLEFPHRSGDAYLHRTYTTDERLVRDPRDRDTPAVEGPVAFVDTWAAEEFQGAGPHTVRALLELFPTALLFGAWHNHGKNRRPFRQQRCFVAETVGRNAVVVGTAASRVDPLIYGGTVSANKTAPDDWSWVSPDPGEGGDPRDATKVAKRKASVVGLGNIAPSISDRLVQTESIERHAALTFAPLRSLRFDYHRPDSDVLDEDAHEAGRALLAAFGLFADRVAAANPGTSLRSNTDLATTAEQLAFAGGPRHGEPVEGFDVAAARQLLIEARDEARRQFGDQLWAGDEIALEPDEQLRQAIDDSTTNVADYYGPQATGGADR